MPKREEIRNGTKDEGVVDGIIYAKFARWNSTSKNVLIF